MDQQVDQKVNEYIQRKEKGYYLYGWGNNYPYNSIKDQYGNELPIKVISAPVYNMDKLVIEQFWDSKKRGDLCLGIMSCGHWPNYSDEDAKYNSRLAEIEKPHMKQIINAIDGWLSCERNHASKIPKSILYSESDLTDAVKDVTPWYKRDIDIVFYGGVSDTEYYRYHKSVDLGVKTLKAIKAATGCRAVYVGEKAYDGLEHQPKLIWSDWLKYLQRCKVLLISAVSDASPRTITDALANGCAVIVNKNIFGGWKYIVPQTGEFFTTPDNAIDAYKSILNNAEKGLINPNSWYAANYGKEKSSLRLRAFCELLSEQKTKDI